MLNHPVQHRPHSSFAVTPKSPSSLTDTLDTFTRTRWEAALAGHQQSIRKGTTLASEGDQPAHLFVVLEGWMQKYRQLPDGRRQIVGFCLPGQVCDANLLTRLRLGHTLEALESVRVAALDHDGLADILGQCPALERALYRADMIAANIEREWLVNIGARSALERVAHLLCELFVRQDPLLIGDEVRFPIIQTELAEATGLTPVHVNRVLRDLRMEHGASARNHKLRITNFAALAKLAGFRRDYLGFDDS